MEIHLIIQQLLKDSQPDDILDESVGKIESLTPVIKVSEGAPVTSEPENSFYVGMGAGVIPTLIVSEELYPFYLDLDPDEFVARLNKTLYEYITLQLENDRNRNVSENDNIWMQPNAEFVKWFHENEKDIESIPSLLDIQTEENIEITDTNDALWAIADDMRARKMDGEFETYMDAYRWAEKNISKKGVNITAKKLELAYHKAKSEGKIE